MSRRNLSDRPRYFPTRPFNPERDAEIRARYEARVETLVQIAADYGISAQRVCMIAKGRTGAFYSGVKTHNPPRKQ